MHARDRTASCRPMRDAANGMIRRVNGHRHDMKMSRGGSAGSFRRYSRTVLTHSPMRASRLLLVCSLLAALPLPAQRSDTITAIVGVTLIDGNGGAPMNDAVVT